MLFRRVPDSCIVIQQKPASSICCTALILETAQSDVF